MKDLLEPLKKPESHPRFEHIKGFWRVTSSLKEDIVVIKLARKIISDERDFADQFHNLDENNITVAVGDPKSVRYSALGALKEASIRLVNNSYSPVRHIEDTVDEYNRPTGHNVILEIFDKTIERLMRSYLDHPPKEHAYFIQYD